MKSQAKTYLQFLADDKNLVVYSNESTEVYNEIFERFRNFCVLEISDTTVENTSSLLLDNRSDVVVIFDNEDEVTISKLIGYIKDFSKDIDILFIAKEVKQEIRDSLNVVDGILFQPISVDDLYKALFGALTSLYTIKNIANTEKSLSRVAKPINVDEFDEFLDTWEGKIMFLSQDIDDIVSRFDSGELSNDLIYNCIEKSNEVGEIFRSTSYTKKVAPVFNELSTYLETIKIENINIKNVEGFEYLSRIMEDINVYIVEYFVDRIFKDVYVFKDSLLNNITFMENKLKGSIDDDSELHFF